MPMKTIEGYSKEKYTDTSVLLAGGGVKALSGFIGSLSWDSTNKKIKYTPASGGNATDLVTLNWDNISGKPINFKAYSGSLASGGWKIMQGNNSSPSIAISYNNNSAAWNSSTYSATLVYGCSDTRGLLDCAYYTPIVTFGGCSYGGATDDNPTWYMKLSGTNGTTYNLDSMPYASSSGTSSYPAGFDLRLTSAWATNGWGMPGTWITGWGTNSGADIAFAKNDGALNVATDGYFYQGADYGHGLVRVMDDWDRQNTIWSNADKLDGYHASSFYENGYVMFKHTIDASGLDTNTWYPVIISIGAHHTVRIEVRVSLNSNTRPSWSTHELGFSVRKIWEVNGSGWGTNQINRRILESDYSFASTDPVRGIGQLGNSSTEYVYVRGGGKYYFYVSHNVSCTLYTTTYSIYSQSVGPTTTTPNAININVGYYCSNAGNADTVDNKHASDFATAGHTHDSRYLRKDTNDSTSYQYSFTKTNDHAIQVGTIRGRAVGSQTGEYIHLYERVAIGSPSGWGSRNAPTYGLATYGGAWLATDTGNVGIGTTSPSEKLEVSGNIRVLNPSDSQIIARFLNYSSAPYGLMIKSYPNGSLHLQSQRESNNSEVFPLLLNPNGGNIGIGTSSPSMKLHVNGDGIYLNSTATCGINMYSSHSESSISYKSNGGTRTVLGTYINRTFLWNESIGEHVSVLSSNGYCGIGTTSPENKLDVNGIQQIYQRGLDNTAFKDLLLLKQQNSTEDADQAWTSSKPTFGIGFRRYWTSGTSPYGETTCAGIYATISSSWRGGLVFRTKNNQTQEGTHDTTALRLRPDGVAEFTKRIDAANLGNSAGYQYAAMQIREYNLGGAQSDTWGNAPRLAWHWSGRVQAQIGLASDNHLYISEDGSFSTPRLILHSGNYSSYALPLSGGTITGLITTTSGGNHNGIKIGNTYINAIGGDLILLNNNAIRFGGDSWDWNVWAGLKYVPSSKSIYLGLADGSAFTANNAQSGGNLYLPGIGTVTCSGIIKVNRAESTTGFFLTSDFRKKNILGNINEYKAYDFVKNCKSIVYELKDDETHDKQLGLIAQEVEEYFPELVITDENGFKSMDYSRLSVVLFALLKDLIKRNKL